MMASASGPVVPTARPKADRPSAAARVLAVIGRMFPFLSGRGFLATSRFYTRLVPREPRVVWATISGSRCLVPLDDLVGRSAFLFSDLDAKVTWALGRVLRPGDVAVDVGANLGVVSLHMARLVGHGGKVVSFEPSPKVLPFLRATLSENPHLPITLVEVACGAQDGEVSLQVPAGNAGAASVLAGRGGGVRCETHRVSVRRLDDCLAATGLEGVRLMKLDVEGFEEQVLRGLFDRGLGLRPDVILLDEGAPASSAAFDVLRENGYALFGIPFRVLRIDRLPADGTAGFVRCHDFVAINREADEDLHLRLRCSDQQHTG